MRVPWILAGLIAGGAAGAAAAQATVAELMKHEVNPAALAFWAAGNDPPEDETPPAAAARWRAAEAAAATLKAEGAVKARDAEAAFEAGGRLYDSCNGCHKAYAPPRG